MPFRAPELFDVKTGKTLDEKVDIWVSSAQGMLIVVAWLYTFRRRVWILAIRNRRELHRHGCRERAIPTAWRILRQIREAHQRNARGRS
jgi:hypothetical protein